MSRSVHDAHRPVFHIGNPFRILLPKPKGSYLSPKHLYLLNGFEENLARRIEKLNTSSKDDMLQLSWLRRAVEQLCGINTDVKALVGTLELPVSDWSEKWIESYLDNCAKLLDISNSFTSHIRKLEQNNLYLLRALRHLSETNSETLINACSSLNKWAQVQQVTSESSQLGQCFSILDGLSRTLDPPKADKSGKERVLTHAMYGVKVVTVFLCTAFAAIFSGSAEKLMDIQIPASCLWGKNFVVLQTCVNTNIRSMFSIGKTIVFRESEAVDAGVKKLVDPVGAEVLVSVISQIRKSSEEYSEGLSLLSEEVDKFFKVLLSGHNVFTDKLAVDFNPTKASKSLKNF